MNEHLPRIGAHPLDDSQTRFVVWAPRHAQVRLVLVDSGRLEAMKPTGDGYHELATRAPAGTRYFFELTGGVHRPDPASRAQPDGVHGPSEVVALSPPPTPFDNRPLSDHVLYELHVGTFTPDGTFDAVIPRLDDLATLGVTSIELMPIAQFPGSRNWGYDGVLLFAAHSSYGGVEGLRRLVEACHKRGLACILDVVYNHLGPEGNYLADFGPYFTDRYRTPWGAALNFDGPDSDHVREYFIQNSLYWTDALGLDGLRLDAVHAIVDHTARTFIEELVARNHAAASRHGRRVHLIAESSDNDPRLVRDATRGGYGLDGCWNDDYHHAVRSAITKDRRGYYAPFGDATQIATCIRDRFVFTGQYSSSFRRRHGAPAGDVAHGSLISFTQNHDHVGNRPLGDRLDCQAGLDGARVAAALVLLGPFTPMLWMGEEYGEMAPFLYFVSHSDPALIAAVREGRAREFAGFQDVKEVPDPQAEETFARSHLNWNLRARDQNAQTLEYYKHLIQLRTQLDIPARASTVQARAVGSVVLVSYGGEPRIMIAANVGATAAHLGLHELGRAGQSILANSDDPRWGGSAKSGGAENITDLTIPGKSVVVLSSLERA